MPYEFTKQHRERLSRSLQGVRNAAGPHQMTPKGRARLRLAQLRRWHAFYTGKIRTETNDRKKRLWIDKEQDTAKKIEREIRKMRQYGWAD